MFDPRNEHMVKRDADGGVFIDRNGKVSKSWYIAPSPLSFSILLSSCKSPSLSFHPLKKNKEAENSILNDQDILADTRLLQNGRLREPIHIHSVFSTGHPVRGRLFSTSLRSPSRYIFTKRGVDQKHSGERRERR